MAETQPNVAAIARGLTEAQRKGLLWLTPGGFVCGLRPEWMGVSQKQYDAMEAQGLLESHWTWASTTRPDTGLSELGLAVQAHIRSNQDEQ